MDSISDEAVEAAGAGTDRVNATVSYTLEDNIESFYVLGDGTDHLDGGTGKDTLIDGNDDDFFYLGASGATNSDTLQWFDHGFDMIMLQDYLDGVSGDRNLQPILVVAQSTVLFPYHPDPLPAD